MSGRCPVSADMASGVMPFRSSFSASASGAVNWKIDFSDWRSRWTAVKARSGRSSSQISSLSSGAPVRAGAGLLLPSAGHQGDGSRGSQKLLPLAGEGVPGIDAACGGVNQRWRLLAAATLGFCGRSTAGCCGQPGFFNLLASVPSRRPSSGDSGRRSPSHLLQVVRPRRRCGGRRQDPSFGGVEDYQGPDRVFDFLCRVFCVNFQAWFNFLFFQGLICKMYPPTF